MIRTRTRDLTRGPFVTTYGYTSGYGNYSSPNSLVLSAKQETTSEGHGRTRVTNRDNGGPFMSRSVSWDMSRVPEIHLQAPQGLFTWRYDGRWWPVSSPTAVQFLDYVSDSQLAVWGTQAIAKCSPTAPKSGLGQAIVELKRDGLPKAPGRDLLRSKTRSARHLAQQGSNEFLNYEFGWLPLVNDVQKTIRALQRRTKIIDQLTRDSGRVVRRRTSLPIVRSVTQDHDIQAFNPGYPPLPYPLLDLDWTWGRDRQETRLKRTVWFSGAFTYYVPPIGGSRWDRVRRFSSEANRLLGMRPDPRLLWSVAPWSWLADWVVDTDALMSNITDYLFDGLVVKYGYVMCHQKEETIYSCRLRDYHGNPHHTLLRRLRETKQRAKATPFGFGLTSEDFTSKQWAILAALGFTRGYHAR